CFEVIADSMKMGDDLRQRRGLVLRNRSLAAARKWSRSTGELHSRGFEAGLQNLHRQGWRIRNCASHGKAALTFRDGAAPCYSATIRLGVDDHLVPAPFNSRRDVIDPLHVTWRRA